MVNKDHSTNRSVDVYCRTLERPIERLSKVAVETTTPGLSLAPQAPRLVNARSLRSGLGRLQKTEAMVRLIVESLLRGSRARAAAPQSLEME